MKLWIDRLVFIAVALIVVALVITVIPVWTGGHLEAQRLIYHMMAGGALVFALPVMAIWLLPRQMRGDATSRIERIGYWATIMAGFICIATVFVCMLPIPSMDAMHVLIEWHGYAGAALIFTLPPLAVGLLRRSK